MNIQIVGTKSCSNTRKAERYFKERRIPFHFRDLNEKGLAKGELENYSPNLQKIFTAYLVILQT
jgi:arsenate reductase-like glutaredoxin family protein